MHTQNSGEVSQCICAVDFVRIKTALLETLKANLHNAFTAHFTNYHMYIHTMDHMF